MGFKLAGVMALLMMTMGVAGAWYYKDTQSRIATLHENNAKLSVAVESKQTALNTLQKQAADSAAQINQLQSDLQKAEQYGDELRSTLQKHNLTVLARKKPGLIEKRINDASNKLFEDITADTTPTVTPTE
jgi:peptidoglycan hydrolase CwlO-like protein